MRDLQETSHIWKKRGEVREGKWVEIQNKFDDSLSEQPFPSWSISRLNFTIHFVSARDNALAQNIMHACMHNSLIKTASFLISFNWIFTTLTSLWINMKSSLSCISISKVSILTNKKTFRFIQKLLKTRWKLKKVKSKNENIFFCRGIRIMLLCRQSYCNGSWKAERRRKQEADIISAFFFFASEKYKHRTKIIATDNF